MAEKVDKNLKIRKRLQRAIASESENRDLALKDIKFRNGQQWPESVKKEREEEGRPCLTFNRTEGFIDQVTGDNRQNKIDIKVMSTDGSPLGPLYEALINQIEYKSKATIAYNTALDHAAGSGFGWIRVNTKYLKGTFDQECEIRRITNQFTVYCDPDATELTKYDAKYMFVSTYMEKEEFEKKYPGKNGSPDTGDGEAYENWYGDKIRLAEYFEIRETEIELCLLEGNNVVEYDPKIPKELILKKRTDIRREVYRSLVTGNDVLEEPVRIPGEFIPLIPVYGKELHIEGKTVYRGVIRHAKDAMTAYNYHRNASAESVGTAPKIPWLATADQVEGYEAIWQTANTKNHSYLPYNHQVGQPIPQRVMPAQVPTGAVNEAMMAVEDLKATTGLFDASLGAKGNETSGKAILARQSQGDNATFAYHDNLAVAIEQVGRVLVSMIPEVYDSSRTIAVRQDGKEQQVPINDPQEDGGVVNDLRLGNYEVVVKTGTSYASQRLEARDTLMQLVQVSPELRMNAMDKVMETFEFPGADELAQRLRPADPNNPPPPTAEQQVEMATQQAEMKKAEGVIATAEAKLAEAQYNLAMIGVNSEQQ